jgi:hypothetical protein
MFSVHKPRPSLPAVASLVAFLAACLGVTPAEAADEVSAYDLAVLADSPDAYWTMGNAASGNEPDLSGSGLVGTYGVVPTSTTLPNGDAAADFDGATQYMEVDDAPQISPATTGEITIEAWMRPDSTVFATPGTTGYTHWMGKGEAGQHEYVSRMYSADNTVARANRISGYLFNASGGLGAGSYFQDTVVAGDWIHYVLVIDSNDVSVAYPHGYTKIYKNGVLRDQDDLSISGTVIVPERGSAPFRVGTRDFGSFFDGAVGKVAMYDEELTATQIAAHYEAMTESTADGS